MIINGRYMGEWGHDTVPIGETDDDIPSFKFMTLNKPVHDEFGGHHYMTGAWRVKFYGSDQAAVCQYQEEKRKDPSNNQHVKWHDIPGPNEFEPDSCNCGIHSQTLNNIHDSDNFRMDTLVQLNMRGKTDYTDAGYRTSHGKVSKIWTAVPLDDHELEKVKNDLGVQVERVPNEFISNSGNPNWPNFIDSKPELANWLPKEQVMHKEWDRQTAAESLDPNKDPDHVPEEHPCPRCGSDDLGLVNNPRGHKHGRLGKCFNCGNTWDRYND